ncbi:Amastin surface glycoprotein [Novymonas esmeraldas]|uniref:Amastin surface glycoprotein n=1 Tax=Novymonas esmeraldas TaxID=1808958 RepID=A0AAW0ERI1_9TRYP
MYSGRQSPRSATAAEQEEHPQQEEQAEYPQNEEDVAVDRVESPPPPPMAPMGVVTSNHASAPVTDDDLKRDFESEVLDLARDRSLNRKERAAKKKALLERQAVVEKERERRAVAAMEAKLPRPHWYTSDDEDDESIYSDVEPEEVSEMKAQPEGGAGFVSLIVYTSLSAAALVFHLVSSCPIPWMRGRNGRLYGIWRATGGGQAALEVRHIGDCSYEMQYWRAASAMSVLATFASLGATISGALMCVGKGHMGASFILSFYSMSFGLVSWALVVALYHYFRCGKGAFASGVARLDAGFALTLIGWVLSTAAIIVLALHFFKYWTRSIHSGKTRAVRFFYVAVCIVTILFYCVGQAYTMWGKTFPGVKASVSMWHVQVYDRETRLSTFLNRRTYRCTTITRRMKVVAAFMIMSLIWLFFAVTLGTGACHDTRYIKGSLIFGYASSIFALVAWITLLVTRHSHLCTGATPAGQSYWTDMGYNGIPSGINNAQINFDGYTLREGFGLIVAGWGISTIAVIFNTVLWDL